MDIKTTKLKTSSFSKTLRPFILICKCLGLANFNLNARNEPTFINHLTIALLGFAWIFNTIVLKLSASNYESGVHSSFINGNYMNLYISSMGSVSFVILFQHFKRKHILSFIQQIERFDEKLDAFKWKFQVNSSTFYMIPIYLYVIPVFSLSCHLLIGLTDNFTPENIIKLISFAMSSVNLIFHFILSQQFILSSMCILLRLKALNKNVK